MGGQKESKKERRGPTNIKLHWISKRLGLALARRFDYSLSELIERLIESAHSQEKRLRRREPTEHLQLKLFDPKGRPKKR